LVECISWKTTECGLFDSYINSLKLSDASKQKADWLTEDVSRFINKDHFSFTECTNKAFDRDLYLFPLLEDDSQLVEFAKSIFKDKIPSLGSEFKVKSTGVHYYPPKGLMGWHTNADQPRWTLYITRTFQEGTSFFRYFSARDETVRTSYDGVGFTFRIFKTGSSGDKLLKHCVYTDIDRWSLGFQVIGEKNE
jgi:hypothetical protein|tara:strand:- start:74 stop:652 length:579 start_codon:yes stop_codon:yes gene_type:complete